MLKRGLTQILCSPGHSIIHNRRRWKQPKDPQVDERIKEMLYNEMIGCSWGKKKQKGRGGEERRLGGRGDQDKRATARY